MKKAYLISAILLTFMLTQVSGQDSKSTSKFPWSLSLSYAPKLGFNFNDSYPNTFYEYYPFAIDLRAGKKFTDKFSYNFGINYNRNQDHVSVLIFDGKPTNIKSVANLIELPIQINYHFKGSPKKFDPYTKLSLRNSFLAYKQEDMAKAGSEPWGYHKSEYCLFLDLGFGANFILNEKFSIVFESSVGYGLVYERSNFGYLEGLLGLRYTFK
jgi:hypothetical protein